MRYLIIESNLNFLLRKKHRAKVDEDVEILLEKYKNNIWTIEQEQCRKTREENPKKSSNGYGCYDISNGEYNNACTCSFT